jgi:hypothetical protein
MTPEQRQQANLSWATFVIALVVLLATLFLN